MNNKNNNNNKPKLVAPVTGPAAYPHITDYNGELTFDELEDWIREELLEEVREEVGAILDADEMIKKANEHLQQQIADQNEIIENLKAAVNQFQKKETLRMEENTATQNVLKIQSKLIQSFQLLSQRQVVKKVQKHRLSYSIKHVCQKTAEAALGQKIPCIIVTPPPPRMFLPEDFSSILARIPVNFVYSPALPNPPAVVPNPTSTASSSRQMRRQHEWRGRSRIPIHPPSLASFLTPIPKAQHRSQVKHIHHHHYHEEAAVIDFATVQVGDPTGHNFNVAIDGGKYNKAMEEAFYYKDADIENNLYYGDPADGYLDNEQKAGLGSAEDWEKRSHVSSSADDWEKAASSSAESWEKAASSSADDWEKTDSCDQEYEEDHDGYEDEYEEHEEGYEGEEEQEEEG